MHALTHSQTQEQTTTTNNVGIQRIIWVNKFVSNSLFVSLDVRTAYIAFSAQRNLVHCLLVLVQRFVLLFLFFSALLLFRSLRHDAMLCKRKYAFCACAPFILNLFSRFILSLFCLSLDVNVSIFTHRMLTETKREKKHTLFLCWLCFRIVYLTVSSLVSVQYLEF